MAYGKKQTYNSISKKHQDKIKHEDLYSYMSS